MIWKISDLDWYFLTLSKMNLGIDPEVASSPSYLKGVASTYSALAQYMQFTKVTMTKALLEICSDFLGNSSSVLHRNRQKQKREP